MKETTSCDPILEQILEDCRQVCRGRVAETPPPSLKPERVNRRRFITRTAKGVIGSSLAVGALVKSNKPAFAQVDQPDLDETALQDLIPVVEVIGERRVGW